MKSRPVAIQTPTSSGGGVYECQIYFELASYANLIRVGDILTDSVSNEYTITGFYNPSTPSETNSTHLFADGWNLELQFVTTDTTPVEDVDYDSSIASPVIADYSPEVAWSSIAGNGAFSIPAYHYVCDLAQDVLTDPGSGEVLAGYYFVDNGGSIYEIVEVISPSGPITVKLYDITESDESNIPSSGLGFTYKPTKNAIGISQAQYFRMDQTARDNANNIEKGLLWENRGVEISINSNNYKNITKLDVEGLEFLGTTISGWNGGSELQSKSTGGNTFIRGFSGFAGHILDGTNNDVNSYIEWDNVDQTTYHRVEPQQDAQDLDILISFQLPSNFSGLVETGTAFSFSAKSSSGTGSATLVSLVDTDGTELEVTGKSTSATSKTEISLTKAEVDTILNPIISSSSSSTATRVWDAADAGGMVYARFKLSGNTGDAISLDQDNAYLYIS
jgi:hypothetical protein